MNFSASIAVALMFIVSLISACGGGNDPAGEQTPPANIMQASSWEIGPVMRGENMSQGLPLTPDVHPEGFSIDIPYPNREAGHAHYITVPTGSLAGKALIRRLQ